MLTFLVETIDGLRRLDHDEVMVDEPLRAITEAVRSMEGKRRTLPCITRRVHPFGKVDRRAPAERHTATQDLIETAGQRAIPFRREAHGQYGDVKDASLQRQRCGISGESSHDPKRYVRGQRQGLSHERERVVRDFHRAGPPDSR